MRMCENARSNEFIHYTLRKKPNKFVTTKLAWFIGTVFTHSLVTVV